MSTLPAFTSLGDLKVETSTWWIMSRSPYEFESYIYIYRTHTQSVITTLVKPWWTHSMVNLHINAPLGRGTARRARPTLGLYAQHLSQKVKEAKCYKWPFLSSVTICAMCLSVLVLPPPLSCHWFITWLCSPVSCQLVISLFTYKSEACFPGFCTLYSYNSYDAPYLLHYGSPESQTVEKKKKKFIIVIRLNA